MGLKTKVQTRDGEHIAAFHISVDFHQPREMRSAAVCLALISR